MNPVMKSCKTCVYGCRDCVGEYFVYDMGVPEPRDSYGPSCSFHNKGMADEPWKIDRIKSSEYDRGTCRHYKYKGYAGWGEPIYPEDADAPERAGKDGRDG